MVAHNFSFKTWEAKAAGSLNLRPVKSLEQVPGQFRQLKNTEKPKEEEDEERERRAERGEGGEKESSKNYCTKVDNLM